MNKHRLHVFQNKIRDVSINELYAVYPEKIAEWSGGRDKEGIVFLNDLYTERLIHKKYDFECECGRVCTAYYRKIMEESYICPECGKNYDTNKIIKIGTLLYEIDKEEVLAYENETLDFQAEDNEIISQNKKESESTRTQMSEKKSIFIGSSSSKDVISFMDEIAVILEELNVRVRKWNDSINPVFKPSKYTYDCLIDVAHETDGAIFIFNSDDELWCSKQGGKMSKVRDNVLLEYGLFTGVHGRNGAAFIVLGNPEKPTLASDLEGITYIDGNKGTNIVRVQIKTWIDSLA